MKVGLLALVMALLGPAGTAPNSGLKIGAIVPAYEAQHATGPDAGTKTCPICKYGMQPGAQLWVNGPLTEKLGPVAEQLEKSIDGAGIQKLRAWITVIEPKNMPIDQLEAQMKAFATEHKLKSVGIIHLPADSDTIKAYQINMADPKVESTLFIYAKMRVRNKFVNIGTEPKAIEEVADALSRAAATKK